MKRTFLALLALGCCLTFAAPLTEGKFIWQERGDSSTVTIIGQVMGCLSCSLVLNPTSDALYNPPAAPLYPLQGGSLTTSDGTWTFSGTQRTGGVDYLILLNNASTGQYATRMQVENSTLYAYSKDNDDWYGYILSAWVDQHETGINGAGLFGSLAGLPLTAASLSPPQTHVYTLTSNDPSLVTIVNTGTNTWNVSLARDILPSDSSLTVILTATP